MIYDVIVFEALTLCVQGQVCFFFFGGGSFSSWAWTCAFLRHDLPLHLVTCGGDASHMTVQIKAASHRKTSMPRNFVTLAISQIFQI